MRQDKEKPMAVRNANIMAARGTSNASLRCERLKHLQLLPTPYGLWAFPNLLIVGKWTDVLGSVFGT